MKKNIKIALSFTLLILCFSGYLQQAKPDAENPITLTMWHVYGSQTESPFNKIIDEFNRTVGMDNGITVNVVSVTSSSAIDKALSASAKNEPGAEDLPDLFTAYPRVAEIVGTDSLLSWDDYFSPKELSAFTDKFLSEGYFDGNLLMLPIAKSSEVFYVNETLFNKFMTDTDITLDTLRTFDGIFSATKKYYDWSGGQNFLQINDYYNYAYVGMKAYDSEFIKNGKLQLDDDAFKKIWTPLAQAAIYGGICLEDGYAAARWKTIEIIANTGSTADVLYQPDTIVYADNTSEAITTLAMPYPVFTETSAGAVHRGGGLFAIKSEDEQKNYASYIFAKWITEKEINLRFVTQAGYLPVTDEAFNTLFHDISLVKNRDYHNLYEAIDTMFHEYEFYELPLYEGASETQLNFEKNVKAVLKSAHNQYIKRVNDGEPFENVLNELTDTSLEQLISYY